MYVTHMNTYLRVEIVAPNVAWPFIRKWHYSGNVPKGKNIYFGWFDRDELYAIADYGIGVNYFQAAFLAKKTGEDVNNNNLLELKRLCRSEPKKNIFLTQFLSKCHKKLKSIGFKYIVSFSDPEYGHSGGIYKAANFIHLGKTDSERVLIDKDGNRFHRIALHRHAKRNGCSIIEAREVLGLKTIKTIPKDRWFLRIG